MSGISPLAGADLIMKETGPTSVAAGSVATYSMTLTNNGPDAAYNVVLTDTVSSSLLTDVGTIGFYAAHTNPDEFNVAGTRFTTTETALGPIASGDVNTFELTCGVVSTAATGVTITNTAGASTATIDPNQRNNGASITTTVTDTADLAVTETALPAIAPATPVTYSITLANNGPNVAQDVVLSETISGIASTQWHGNITPSGRNYDNFAVSSSGETVTETAASPIAPGNVDVFLLAITPVANVVNGTLITSTATVAESGSDPNTSNNTSAATTTVVQPTDMAVGESGPATVVAGTPATYTFYMQNKGGVTASGVVVVDKISGITPGQFVINSVSPASNNTDAFTPSIVVGRSAIIETANAAIPVGNVDIFTVVITPIGSVPAGTQITSGVSVSALNPDPDTSNDSTAATTTVSAAADLAVAAAAPATAAVGTNFAYTVTVTNKGPSDAGNVAVTDTLPNGLTPVSAKQSTGNDVFSAVTVGSTVTFTAASVAAGGSDVLVVNAMVGSGLTDESPLTDSVSVSSATTDPNATNNHATATTAVIGPERTLVATGSASAPILFTIGADGKLYQHTNTTGWTAIGAAGSVQAISAIMQTNGTVVLYAEGTDHSLSIYIVGVGWQGTIGGKGTIQTISAGLDHTGQADVFVIDINGNLDEYSTAGGWRNAAVSPAGAPVQLSAVDNDRVYVVTANQSVYGNDAVSGWFPLTGPGFASSISATTDGQGNDTVYAVTVNEALFEHVNATGWTQLGGAGTVERISAGRDSSNKANVFVVTTANQFLENDTVTGWSLLNPPAPASKLSATFADTVFAVLADGSVYAHNDTFGFFAFAGPGFAEV